MGIPDFPPDSRRLALGNVLR